MKSILFVCLGNICRSPIADGIANKIVMDNKLDIKVDSAGTYDGHKNEPPFKDSITICKKYDLDISNLRARVVTKKDFDEFDLIVGLDSSNIDNLKKMGAKNVVKLGSFGLDDLDVVDPYYYANDLGMFDKVYKMIETGVINIFKSKNLID